MIIVISGKSAAGTATIARKVAERLKLRFFDAGAFYKKHSKQRSEVKQALELLRSKEGVDKDFHEYIDDLQKAEAKKGDIVDVAKLGIFMLKDIADVKVWVECSFEERAKRMSKRDNISFGEAKESLKEKQDRERKMFKKIYGLDYFKQKELADIVIDSTDLTEEETVDRILEFIKSKHG